ncbi:MAG: hypothetical protein LHW64_10795 [Candidatus Cloacimonetes bacterium]|nr:hypothetical protein [Candidatus Cloacimonadota bacterium]MDY0230588.1 hypothetical protein [Candidatus Cloacimonadaceae bacterium]
MAWVTGELITAAKLNSENTGKYTNYHCEHTAGKASINATYTYMHQTTGRILYLRTKGTAYWWAEGDGIVYFRNSVGAVTEHVLWYESDTTSRTIERTIYMETFGHGPGWYSARVWVNRGWADIDMYWGQDNCWRGGRLVYYDNPTTSGNRIIGEKLTAAILNTGRVGVM